MRTWIWGGCLAAVTAGGVYFLLSGSGHSHCGGCLTCPGPVVMPASPLVPDDSPPPVVEVVDVRSVLAERPEPRPLAPVSFDEPPLAKRPGRAPDVIPAAFTQPVEIEVAPMPRPVPPAAPGRLATPADPF